MTGPHLAGFYEELMRLLPNYPAHVANPQATPPNLRDHKRLVKLFECADGYIIWHHSDPNDQCGTGLPLTFEVHPEYQATTVGAASQEGFPPYGDFAVATSPLFMNNKTGEYVQSADLLETVEYISNNRVAQLTEEQGRKEARENLQRFFDNPNNPFLKNQPDK
jgi:hypothetical protein